MGKEDYFMQKSASRLKEFLIEDSKNHVQGRKLVFNIATLTLMNTTCIILSSLLYFAIMGEPYDAKVLGVAISYSLLLSRHLLDSIGSTMSLENQLLSLQRLSALESISIEPLQYPSELIPHDKSKASLLIEGTKEETNVLLNSKQLDSLIVFSGVDLKYHGSSVLALDDLSFSINEGEKVAFCGRTGSGKSSIFSLLLRMYPYQRGLVSFDDKPVSETCQEDLRKEVAMIPQNGFLFRGTLKENLDPEGRYSNSEINSFMEKMGLESVFEGKGLDFIVGKDGGNLSNGEKQVINVVQNVMSAKRVVLLDEATSNLDPELDKLVMSVVMKAFQGRTVMMISHRLEGLAGFDKIFVMERGKIKESGTMEELSKEKGSLFNRLRQKI